MNLPSRKLPRLKKYDYATDGYYFVTICAHDRRLLFGDINNLNEIGTIIKNELENIPAHFENVIIDKSVVMPNHVHCIIIIGCDGDAERSRPFPTLSGVIGLYKSGVTRFVHKTHPDMKVWQRSFHDHIIRSEKEYQKIWQYIDENPAKWAEDCYFTS